jgi:anti-sigma B factor antagonist
MLAGVARDRLAAAAREVQLERSTGPTVRVDDRAREEPMGFPVWREGEVTVIGIDGGLGVSNRLELKRLMLDALRRGEREFRLDFSRSGVVDAAGLGVLASLHKRTTERGGTLVLAGLGADLRRLLALTRLDLFFRIEGEGGGASDLAAARRPLVDPATGGSCAPWTGEPPRPDDALGTPG